MIAKDNNSNNNNKIRGENTTRLSVSPEHIYFDDALLKKEETQGIKSQLLHRFEILFEDLELYTSMTQEEIVAFLAIYKHNKSDREAGRLINRTHKTAKSRGYSAIEKIKKYLGITASTTL